MSKFLHRFDWFLTCMVLAVGLAWLFPEPGSQGGVMHPELLSTVGVAVIFFLHGLLLSFRDLKYGALQWRAHAAILSATFILFPLLGLVFYKCTHGIVDPDLQLGFFFLCALPSTVSSAIAMTAVAKGNVAVAISNATLSSLLGIIVTPLWVGFILHHKARGGDLTTTIVNLCQWMLLPLVLGQVLEPWIGHYARAHKKYVGKTDRVIILLLVYSSFCDSFKQHVWFGNATQGMLLTVTAVVALFFVILFSLWKLCDRFGVLHELRSAIVFCGTKKTLGSGIPMARLIFGAHPGIGLILLPIMIYHPLQLFVTGPLASYWARQKDKPS